MQKHYKEYKQKYLGSSDTASLTIRFFDKESESVCHELLTFVCDGDYDAYIVDENAKIGEHYKCVFDKAVKWLHIIDDFDVSFKTKANHVKIYRSGNYGCIVQVFGEWV